MWLNSPSWTMDVILILVIFSERCKIISCAFEECLNSWMKGHLWLKWIYLNLPGAGCSEQSELPFVPGTMHSLFICSYYEIWD